MVTHMKIKTLKEYLGGFRLGNYDNITPIASLGDRPPKGQGGKDSRGVGLHANYSTQAPGTMRPFITANTKRVPRKPGQKAGSDKHSDLYTDENPKGTIHGLGFTDAETARTSVNKIKNSGKTHAHKIQAAIAMSQRAKVASERAKDPKKKKDLAAAHKVYQSFIDTNKKKD
jgi:hypothetical protein